MNTWYDQNGSNTNEDLLAAISDPPTTDYDNTFIKDHQNTLGVLTYQVFKMPTYTYRNKDHFLGMRYMNNEGKIDLALTLSIAGETSRTENYQLILQKNFSVYNTGIPEWQNYEAEIPTLELIRDLRDNSTKVWLTLTKLGTGNLTAKGFQNFLISSLYIRGEGDEFPYPSFKDSLKIKQRKNLLGLKPVWLK